MPLALVPLQRQGLSGYSLKQSLKQSLKLTTWRPNVFVAAQIRS
jgi:hypothetical protein